MHIRHRLLWERAGRRFVVASALSDGKTRAIREYVDTHKVVTTLGMS